MYVMESLPSVLVLVGSGDVDRPSFVRRMYVMESLPSVLMLVDFWGYGCGRTMGSGKNPAGRVGWDGLGLMIEAVRAARGGD